MSVDSGYSTLHDVVMKVQSDLKDYGTTNYQRYLDFAMNAYDELVQNVIPQIKTVYLDIEKNFVVPFPDDYLHYTAIGIVCAGRIITLTLDDSIALDRRSDCPVSLDDLVTAPQDFINTVPYSYVFSTAFRNGQYVGEQFGIGGGWNRNGYYKVNASLRRFEFMNTIPSREIILEYVATGIDCNGVVEIHKSAVPVIRAHIHYQIDRFDRTKSLGEKEWSHGQYVKEFNIFKHYNLMFTYAEFLDNKYQSTKILRR
jgi:hypothetical protein